MSNQKSEKELAARSKELEYAATNLSAEEIAETYARLGEVEYTARALGIACRFRGVECVRALVEGGASFHAPLTNYMYQTYGSYGDDLSVLLLDNFPDRTITYFVVTRQIYKSVTCADGSALSPLPFEERVKVVDYLNEHAEQVEFDLGELLYFAIMFNDLRMTKALEQRGAGFSEQRVKTLAEKGKPKDLCIWTCLLERLSAENFVTVLTRIVEKVGGKLHCTDGVYKACEDKLYTFENLDFYFNNFEPPKINKTDVMKRSIDLGSVSGLQFAEKSGWLAPKKRDEMIAYANEKNAIECTAWLLDFKNRTADLADERKKAEKKIERELNANPNSAAELRKVWSFKKLEDETLIITNYRGKQTKITVPAKIGKSAVTAIGKEAFSPFRSRVCHGREFFRTITEITLPDGIAEIGEMAFDSCLALTTVVVPKSVSVIGKAAFANCKGLTVTVERGSYAEEYCRENDVKFEEK